MEFGDIIYFILLVFFLILGFFNDSRKKKQQQEQKETQSGSFLEDEKRSYDKVPVDMSAPSIEKGRKVVPPPIYNTLTRKNARVEFQSSADLVSIHDEQSTQPGYAFDYDANSFYEKDLDSSEVSDNDREETLRRTVHPLIRDLKSGLSPEELKKGLIYSEILHRKY